MRLVEFFGASRRQWGRRRGVRSFCTRRFWGFIALAVTILLCSGCGERLATPTRTPFPTWTPTPQGDNAALAGAQAPTPAPPTNTPAPLPPTSTPAVTDTPPPTATPVPAATDTPTLTPEPSPTPTVAFAFVLETAEKFPTESLTPNVVRIYLYVYSDADMGLGGYSLSVIHNGAPLVVDEVSQAGAPDVTRTEPSPYTRFTNMNVVFVEAQAGRWEIQLVDPQRKPAGPAAVFDLTADENTRELYVRYRR